MKEDTDTASVLQGFPVDKPGMSKKDCQSLLKFYFFSPGLSDIKGLGAAANRSLLLSGTQNKVSHAKTEHRD